VRPEKTNSKNRYASIKISIIATDITIVGINGNGLVVDSNTDMVKTAGGEEDDDAAKYASRKGDRNDDWVIRVVGNRDRKVIVKVRHWVIPSNISIGEISDHGTSTFSIETVRTIM